MEALNDLEVLKLIGYISVDSGQIMITDPCYISSEWDHKTTANFTPGKNLSYSYAGASNASMSRELGQVIGNGLGVSVASGYGDGVYPVYAVYSDEGVWGTRIKEIRVVFIKHDNESIDQFFDEEQDDDDYS